MWMIAGLQDLRQPFGVPADLGAWIREATVTLYNKDGVIYAIDERGRLVDSGDETAGPLASARDALGTPPCGKIFLDGTHFPFHDEVVFDGGGDTLAWRGVVIEGLSRGTRLYQEYANKRIFVFRNRACFGLRNLQLHMRTTGAAREALLLDDAGANEESARHSFIDNVFVRGGVAAYPLVRIINPFHLTVGYLDVLAENGDCVEIVNSSDSISFGNSLIEHLKCKPPSGKLGLKLISTGAAFLNLLHFGRYEMTQSGATWGVYAEFVKRISFDRVDIDNADVGIECTGPTAAKETQELSVESGYILVPSGGTGIKMGANVEGCSFGFGGSLHIFGDAGATYAVEDLQGSARRVNSYKLKLAGIFTPTDPAEFNIGTNARPMMILNSSVVRHLPSLIRDIWGFKTDSNLTWGAVGRVYLTPIYISKPCFVDRIAFVHASACTGNFRAGVYEDNGGTPVGGALIVESASVAGTGTWRVQEITISEVFLTEGLYWLAIANDTDTDRFLAGDSVGTGGTLTGHRFDQAYGAFPDPCPATAVVGYPPSMYVRVET